MNPTGQPFHPQLGGAPPPAGPTAKDQLNLPGILFIVFGALGVLFGVYGLISSGASNEQLDQLLRDPNLPPALKSFFTTMAGPGAKVTNLLGMLLSGLVAFGGVQMRQLKGYGLVVASCVVAMIPCGNCCCVTLPIAVWALTIITKPEVKAQFT